MPHTTKAAGLLAATLLATGAIAVPATAAPAPASAAEAAPAKAAAPAYYADAAPASAIRTAAGSYALHWSGLAGPVAILVAAAPDADGQVVASNVTGDFADVRLPAGFAPGARPYFRITPASSPGLTVAERLLPLEGGRNFRDLGGYATADGHHVRWGLLFRSGAMANLTPTDQQYLAGIGLRQVCDFRTTSERKQEPASWLETGKIGYWTRDYEMSGADFGRMLRGEMTGDAARADFARMYGNLPYEQETAYRDMFRMLVAGDAPLAFNCTAGKDRTGMAAALILSALGVPRATILADYELTNRYLRFDSFTSGAARNPSSAKKDSKTVADFRTVMARLSPDVVHALLAADPAYLDAAFAGIDQRDGSVTGYLTKTLGLTQADLATLRTRYLQP